MISTTNSRHAGRPEKAAAGPDSSSSPLPLHGPLANEVEQFICEGALRSHLENLQRHGGFKGFNQKSVSAVTAATDPRKRHFPPTAAAA